MIKVTDRFYIDANMNCYTLREKTIIQSEESKNCGQIIFKDIGYYSNLESCLQGMLKITTREYISRDEERNIKELMEEIKRAEEYLKDLNLKV